MGFTHTGLVELKKGSNPMLERKKKDRIIKEYATHEGDTGSPEVQVALLSKEIDLVAGHLKTHRKDHSSRRGLLGMVNQRRKLLNYLKRTDENRYKKLIKKLGLKK